MKKWLKSEICGSVNSAHNALFTGKVKHFGSKKKKKKTAGTQNVRLGWGVFGSSISITHNFVFITHNSKMMGPIARSPFGTTITLFP